MPSHSSNIRSQKRKADCRADTRGGGWAGIPTCVINSSAYQDLSVHARSILVEIVARMNGWNNGAIAIGQRELRERLKASPRKIVASIVELVDHGFVDIAIEGQWKPRLAREYRLTFVNTKTHPATNEYLRWKEKCNSGLSGAEPAEVKSASASEADYETRGTNVVPQNRKTPRFSGIGSASDGVPLIDKPYPIRGTRNDRASENAGIAAIYRAKLLISQKGYGSQGKLAVAAGLTASRLSRLLNGASGRRTLSIFELDRLNAAITALGSLLPSGG